MDHRYMHRLLRHSLMLGCLALAALLMLSMPQSIQAQVLYGSIVGNVTDKNGAAVAGATVTISNKETNQSRETTTDEVGNYRFTAVQTGNYDVRISMKGFKTYTQTAVPITLNNITRVDSALEVGAVEDTIEVTAEAALLQTDRAEVRADVSEQQLENLPVPPGRNYQNLFKTLPGFSTLTEPHSIASNPSRSLEFNVNGVSKSINNTRIDGASSINVWLPHVTAYIPALESIQEVNVVTNSFDAEQGLAGGAAINVQIKSGTNDLHGSAFEYHNSHALKAKPVIFPANLKKPKAVFNQFGGTLGGPIKRDKLFYFFSYEATRRFESVSTGTRTVPTAAMRQGLLSASKTDIYNPFTGNANGTNRQKFDLSKPIPIDPIAAKLIALMPLPNLPNADGTIPETNNYLTVYPFSFTRWTIDSKVNWNITDKFNTFGRYSVLDFTALSPTVFGAVLQGNPLGGGNPGTGFGKTHSFSIGGTYTLRPNLILDGNFGFVRMNTNSEQSDLNTKPGTDLLGIPGTNGPSALQGGMPRFNISSFSTFGTTETYMPYYRSDDQYQYVLNFNWSKGAHSIRFGSDIYFQQLNHIQPEFNGTSQGARGGFDFGSGPTQACLTTSSSGSCTSTSQSSLYNSWATFLLGLSTSAGKLFETVEPFTTRQQQYSFYIRDQWQARSNLTLSIGTRWEHFPMATRADRGLEIYDLATNKMKIGGIGSVPEDLGIDVGKGMFAPRFGLAYRPTPTFVIRAGFGITSDPYSLARPLRTNHPVVINLNVNAPNSLSWARRLSEGIPSVTFPDLGNGIIDVPGNVATNTLPDKFRRGYVESWNFTLQKELKWGFVGEVGYIGTHQVRQMGFLDQNWSPIGGGNNGKQLRQQFGRDAQTLLVTSIGGSRYDSLQARLNRRFADFYSFTMNYTWSKSIGIAGADNSDNEPRIKIPSLYHLNRALSGFDRPHNLQISNIMELPIGKGRRFSFNTSDSFANKFFNAILGDWQINNIISIYSGTPFSISASGTSVNTPSVTQRADQVKPKVDIFGNIGRGALYFDPTAFAPVNEVRLGNVGYNTLRGPGFVNWDFGVFRKFNISERVDLQFRLESFNFTNTPHWNNPDGSITSSSFAQVTGARSDERQFRVGLRLGF